MSLEDDLTACAGLLDRGDPHRFRAAMAAPLALRRGLLPLYAFNLEVARAPWVTQEPMIAEMRLQWWRDALEEISAGGAVRRHEVVTPLAATLDAEGARALDGLIAARRADIETRPHEGRDSLQAYLDATAGELLWQAGRMAGSRAEAALRAAGRAQGAAAYLAAVPELVAKGRHPLPPGDAPSEMRALAQSGRAALDEARRAGVDRAARPVLAALASVRVTLMAIETDPEAALSAPPAWPQWRDAMGRAAIVATGRF
ncbi:squalene/phytoene synthase family protein [Jannaschia seohaensis]|uniref:Phytoene/squalene synthetase n=1 Tax=Jannaschia seohaensis TaxID=475081 RepID=A0A2Y9C770_9RHOB|nr:squalene/phytoene synthase family protein [Jannaschia seohaensis]PWJ20467.1 phytoene/squalene synthetase [Jannaschia seohaensis]SSA44563.1 Phytoene/squalene synthetase [Jannaschia seohaensis]